MFTVVDDGAALTLHLYKWVVHLQEQQPQRTVTEEVAWGSRDYEGYVSPGGWRPPDLEPHDVGLELEMLAAVEVEGDTSFQYYDAEMLDEFLTVLSQSFEIAYTVEPLAWEDYADLDGRVVGSFAEAEALVLERKGTLE